jgi:hypothetical protein
VENKKTALENKTLGVLDCFKKTRNFQNVVPTFYVTIFEQLFFVFSELLSPFVNDNFF